MQPTQLLDIASSLIDCYYRDLTSFNRDLWNPNQMSYTYTSQGNKKTYRYGYLFLAAVHSQMIHATELMEEIVHAYSNSANRIMGASSRIMTEYLVYGLLLFNLKDKNLLVFLLKFMQHSHKDYFGKRIEMDHSVDENDQNVEESCSETGKDIAQDIVSIGLEKDVKSQTLKFHKLVKQLADTNKEALGLISGHYNIASDSIHTSMFPILYFEMCGHIYLLRTVFRDNSAEKDLYLMIRFYALLIKECCLYFDGTSSKELSFALKSLEIEI